MTAATTPRRTRHYGQLGNFHSYPVKASAIILAGTLVGTDATGNLVPMTSATGLICQGRARESKNATGLSSGAITAETETGIFGWANSSAGDLITQADIGATVYAVDNQTVAKTDGTGTRSAAGKVVRIEDGLVYVQTGLGTV